MLFLVVDDDALSRDLLTLLLEAEGYEVEAAVSGEAAVARANLETRPVPDVVLTDMQMPGLTGDALAKALRSTLRDKQTLLLAMSGSRPQATALAAFDGFLLKPFNLSELKAMVSEWQSSVPVIVLPALIEPGVTDADPSGTAAIDEEIYTKLGELMPVEQLGQMYALCTGDARKRIARMGGSMEAGDEAQYRAEAHAVKGGCGMIGAKELYQLAAAAERDGLLTSGDVPGTNGVTAALTQMLLACDRLERILDERTRA